MNRFEELEAFVAVVDYEGFGRAADKLGTAKSKISRRVSDLERRLGVQLLQRTTRRQALTEDGREFYQRARQVLSDLDEAEHALADSQRQVSGNIRLALPLGFGINLLAEPVSDFMTRHPEVRIDIDLNDRQVDLIAENIDLAIRIGDLEDSSLIARRLARVHFATCASPDYLKRHGEPKLPAELSGHEVMSYSNVPVGRQWSFGHDGKRENPRVKYRLSANNGEFLAAAACCGLGIVSGPLAFLQAHIESGALVPILTDYGRDEAGMYAVYPPGRLISGRVRALSDAFYEHFRERSI